MTQARRLAICVDDFGLHAGINRAVLQLAALDRLNAVGCMVGAPAWRAGSAALTQLDPAATDVGLHLDFTEHPIDAGLRTNLPQLIVRAYARRLDKARIAREIAAQLDAFEAALGRPPDYVDGHQHVHQLPVIRDVLVAALLRRAAKRRPWLRRTCAPATPGGLKPRIIEALGAHALERRARAAGFAQNAHLLGVYDFSGDIARYRALIDAWLAAAVDGDVLMCHPSLADGAGDDALIRARTQEFAVLADPAFSGRLARAGIVTAPISRIVLGA